LKFVRMVRDRESGYIRCFSIDSNLARTDVASAVRGLGVSENIRRHGAEGHQGLRSGADRDSAARYLEVVVVRAGIARDRALVDAGGALHQHDGCEVDASA